VRFSHDVQGGLGGVQPLVQTGIFLREPGDLSLLGGQLADLLARLLARQHAGIALLTPLADQRRVQAFPPQVPAAVVLLARRLVGFQMGEVLRRGERAPPTRPVTARVLGSHPLIIALNQRGHARAGHLSRSVSRPASGRLL
jgi:hypothetical protein